MIDALYLIDVAGVLDVQWVIEDDDIRSAAGYIAFH